LIAKALAHSHTGRGETVAARRIADAPAQACGKFQVRASPDPKNGHPEDRGAAQLVDRKLIIGMFTLSNGHISATQCDINGTYRRESRGRHESASGGRMADAGGSADCPHCPLQEHRPGSADRQPER
jgi:hypothetical protein